MPIFRLLTSFVIVLTLSTVAVFGHAADATSFTPLSVTTEPASGLFRQSVITASGTWTVPDGVTKIRIFAAAGGSSAQNGGYINAGGNTSVLGAGFNIVAYGGGGLYNAGHNPGRSPVGGTGGEIIFGGGGGSGELARCGVSDCGYNMNGLDGGLVISEQSVVPSQIISINVGAGGVIANQYNAATAGGPGEPGYVIIQY